MFRTLIALTLAAAGLWQGAPGLAQAGAPGAAASKPAFTEFKEKAVGTALLQALRKGGFVLYMRHATTDTNRPDRVPSVDLDDCATQRPLTDAGRKLARQIGRYLLEARIPVTEVWVSPLCRTRETAQLAFGERAQVDRNLTYTANLTATQKQPLLAAARQHLSTPVAPGGNRVLVSHSTNLADLIGYYITPEGTMAVFAPKGNGQFDYLGSIHPDDWPALLR